METTRNRSRRKTTEEVREHVERQLGQPHVHLEGGDGWVKHVRSSDAVDIRDDAAWLLEELARLDRRRPLTTDEPLFRIGERLDWCGKNPGAGPVLVTGIKVLGAPRSILGTTFLYEIRRLAFAGAAAPNGEPHWIPAGPARDLLVQPGGTDR